MVHTVRHVEGENITLFVNGFPSALAHAMHIDATNPCRAFMQRPIPKQAAPALGGSVHCTLTPPRPVHTRACCCPMHVAGWRHESVEIRIANPTHQGRTFAEWTRAIGESSRCRRGLLERFGQSSSAIGNLALVGSNRIKACRGS